MSDLNSNAALAAQPTETQKNRTIFGFVPKKPQKLPILLLIQILLPIGISLIFQGIANVIASMIVVFGNPDLAQGIAMESMGGSQGISSENLMSAMMTSPAMYILMAIAYVAMIGVYLLIVNIVEEKNAGSIGLGFSSGADRKKAVLSYLRGLGIGAAMMTAVFGLLIATGNASIVDIGIQPEQTAVFISMLVMWIPQGATEEIMTRGYMMSRISPKLGRAGAVAVSSALFAAMHMGNNGVNVIAIMNLVAVAAFFALLTLLTEELWTVCALHTIWNLTQGNIFGFWVSGNAPAASVLSTASTVGSQEIITGGAFGPEGGLVVTFVTGVAIAVVSILLLRRRNSNAG